MEIYVEKLFNSVLNMSITSSAVIAAVILVRLLLKKAPKYISYGLWFVVLFRLLCPASFQSPISLFGLLGTGSYAMEHIPDNIGTMQQPQVNLIVPAITDAVNTSLPAATPVASINPMQAILFVMALVWISGVVILLAYSTVSYVLLKRRISTATVLQGNIYRCDRISSPFVCGFLRPKVYLPLSLDGSELDYIICHEQTHISRRDHLVKPIWFLALCIHWFNPLVWLAFRLMSRDMEMSCDEAVLRAMGESIKEDYSSSLLALSAPGRLFAGSPLAFGESSTFSRIKNVLNYKRPAFWVIAAALAAAVITGAVVVSDPEKPAAEQSLAMQLLKYKTEYVGDNSKVGGIISLLEFPEAVRYDHFELKTAAKPYGVTVHLRADSTAREYYSEPLRRREFERAAAIMLSLIDNVEVISFRLSDGKEENDLELLYSRVWADEHFGRDVRAFSESEAAFNKLLNEATASAPSGAQPAYMLMKLGRNGRILAGMQLLGDEEKRLAGDTIMNYMVKSAAWTGVDLNSLEECYLIKASYGDGSPVSDYYAFMLDGNAFMQNGKSGHYSRIDNKLYDALAALANSHTDVSQQVEEKLSIIMSSPLYSSNPGDYIKAHSDEYEKILKLGEAALNYMLSCFEKGEGDTLKGHIMMVLCNELLGPRSNLQGELLIPSQWYARLRIRTETPLPDYSYTGNDPIMKLVYATEIAQHKLNGGGFVVAAPHIFGSYEEGNKLKIFVTTYYGSYHLYDRELVPDYGGVVPSAITYMKNEDGSYTLLEHTQAMDGAYWKSSIEEYCVMPVSGKKIPGLSGKIISHYSDYSDIIQLHARNLEEHLKANGQYDVVYPKK